MKRTFAESDFQDDFDQVVNHFLRDKNRPAFTFRKDTGNVLCCYQDSDGNRCAFGCLLPPEDLRALRTFDLKYASGLPAEDLLPALYGVDTHKVTDFYSRLQGCHDKAVEATWVTKYSSSGLNKFQVQIYQRLNMLAKSCDYDLDTSVLELQRKSLAWSDVNLTSRIEDPAVKGIREAFSDLMGMAVSNDLTSYSELKDLLQEFNDSLTGLEPDHVVGFIRGVLQRTITKGQW
jgi:hypothetical protein